MLLYWSIFTVIALLCVIEQYGNASKENLRFVFFAVVIILFIISSLRWERGTDWNAFYSFFLFPNAWKNPLSSASHFEVGYYICNWIVRLFTSNYSVFLTIQSACYYILLTKVIERTNELYANSNKSFYFLLLVLAYSQDFAGIFSTRSQIAHYLCILSLFEIKEKNRLKFCVYIIFAFMFHKTAIVFFFSYYVFFYEKTNWIFFLKGFIVIYTSNFTLNFLINHGFLQIGTRDYSMYINEGSNSIVSIGLLQWIIWGLYFLFIGKKNSDNVLDGYIRIFIVGVLIYILGSIFTNVAYRVAAMFLNSMIVILPRFILSFDKNSKSRLAILLVYLLYAAISVYQLLNGPYGKLYYPYKSIFDDFDVIIY